MTDHGLKAYLYLLQPGSPASQAAMVARFVRELRRRGRIAENDND